MEKINLVVCEKHSVGTAIAGVLGARESGNGFMRNSEYIITWYMGHLTELAEA